MKFVFRQKRNTKILGESGEYQTLESLGLKPGMKWFLQGVKVTQQQGMGDYNVGGYWKRKSQGKVSQEGWYLLTNLTSESETLAVYKSRWGIESLFKDCKTGGYNLEGSHLEGKRLENLILLIAMAYTVMVVQGRKCKDAGVQKYISRTKEYGRVVRRHSSFWVGIYGTIWVATWEFLSDLVEKLCAMTPGKRPNFFKGMKALNFIQSCL